MGSSIVKSRLAGVPSPYLDVYVLCIPRCIVVVVVLVWSESVVMSLLVCHYDSTFFSLPGVTNPACWKGYDGIKY